MIDAEAIQRRHLLLFGEAPSEDQKRLYLEFPNVRGFSDKELDPGRFQAVVTIALAQAHDADKVLLLAPVAHDKWVLDQFNSLADHIFSRCRTLTGDRVRLAKYYGVIFKRIYIAGRGILQLSEMPMFWAAFGFEVSDPLPKWVQEKLLQM